MSVPATNTPVAQSIGAQSVSSSRTGSRPGRRGFLAAGFVFMVAGLGGQQGWAAGDEKIDIDEFDAAGKRIGTVRVSRVVKSDAQWRSQLSAAAFQVSRQAGTERPYSGEYAKSHGDGLYRCICCETALFDSRTKFESGTGWPSFWDALSKLNVVKSADNSLGMQRDAISCGRCDAHLGHVFDDGPRPTGLRYCMNSVSLKFIART